MEVLFTIRYVKPVNAMVRSIITSNVSKGLRKSTATKKDLLTACAATGTAPGAGAGIRPTPRPPPHTHTHNPPRCGSGASCTLMWTIVLWSK